MSELNESLLLRIKCPACYEYMTNNIFACSMGHSICHNCVNIISVCPTCRAAMRRTRNYQLEDIAKLLDYPCDYRDEGCDVYVKLNNQKQHVAVCPFRPFVCLLKDDDSEEECGWTGPKSELAQHAHEKHETSFWMREESLDRWKDDLNKNEIQLIEAYDELFFIFRQHYIDDAVPEKTGMYWIVQHLGSPEDAAGYGYQISIYNDDQLSFRGITCSEICADGRTSVDDIISTGHCINVPMQSLNTFRNEHNVVWFKVNIKKF